MADPSTCHTNPSEKESHILRADFSLAPRPAGSVDGAGGPSTARLDFKNVRYVEVKNLIDKAVVLHGK